MSLAAEELYVSRQALSKVIKEMEQELDTILFIRSKNGVRPTDEGIKIARHATVILDEYNQLNVVAKDHEKEELTIFTFDDIIDYLSDDFIVEHTKRFPNIVLHFVEGTDLTAHDNLLLHHCDLAIVPDSIDVSKFEHSFLFHSQYGVIINVNNPLSKKETVSFEDLSKEKVIGKNRELLYYQSDLDFIRNNGCDVKPIVEVSKNSVARQLVEKNLGIAFAWDYSINNYLSEGKTIFRPLMKKGWGRNIYCIQNKDTLDDKKIIDFKKFLLEWINASRT